MSPHNKTTSLVLSTLFLLVCAATFFFFHKKIIAMNVIATTDDVAWQTEDNQRNEIKSLDTSLDDITVEKTELESHFAQNSDIVPFLDTIENLGTESQTAAEVTSVDVLDDNEGLSVGITASGSFEAVYKFLTLLENSPYELEFTTADISKNGGNATGDVSAPGKPTPSAGSSSWTATLKVQLLTFVNQ